MNLAELEITNIRAEELQTGKPRVHFLRLGVGTAGGCASCFESFDHCGRFRYSASMQVSRVSFGGEAEYGV